MAKFGKESKFLLVASLTCKLRNVESKQSATLANYFLLKSLLILANRIPYYRMSTMHKIEKDENEKSSKFHG